MIIIIIILNNNNNNFNTSFLISIIYNKKIKILHINISNKSNNFTNNNINNTNINNI